MSAKKVKLCRDCHYSIREPGSEWNLRCTHPSVNACDPYALAGSKPIGSCAREERSQNWTLFKIFPCGMRGALFSEKRTGAESK